MGSQSVNIYNYLEQETKSPKLNWKLLKILNNQLGEGLTVGIVWILREGGDDGKAEGRHHNNSAFLNNGPWVEYLLLSLHWKAYYLRLLIHTAKLLSKSTQESLSFYVKSCYLGHLLQFAKNINLHFLVTRGWTFRNCHLSLLWTTHVFSPFLFFLI